MRHDDPWICRPPEGSTDHARTRSRIRRESRGVREGREAGAGAIRGFGGLARLTSWAPLGVRGRELVRRAVSARTLWSEGWADGAPHGLNRCQRKLVHEFRNDRGLNSLS